MNKDTKHPYNDNVPTIVPESIGFGFDIYYNTSLEQCLCLTLNFQSQVFIIKTHDIFLLNCRFKKSEIEMYRNYHLIA